ncbi:MAG: HIT family protein [Steroidobacteraceae bacterium]|nr:HIT family protein [Pseudomonadota bacterium]
MIVSVGVRLARTQHRFQQNRLAPSEKRRSTPPSTAAARADLDREFRPAGYNIGINDGTAAGQTVPHLHIHLIPRYSGDAHDPRGGVRWVLPDKAAYWDKS